VIVSFFSWRKKEEMGRLKEIISVVDKGIGLADQAITDKDALIAFKADLIKTRTQYLLSGRGASITKITICGLVAIVTLIGCFKFLVQPEDMLDYKDFVLALTPLIGILIGAYGSGSLLKGKFKK
jgi:hypothetical protein